MPKSQMEYLIIYNNNIKKIGNFHTKDLSFVKELPTVIA